MKRHSILLLVFFFLISGCGSRTPITPTISGEDVQATAVSMAWTLAAQTMGAIPTSTATPIPPTLTPTPFPTETTKPLPTIPLVPPTNTPSSSSGGGCNQPLTSWLGQSTTMNISNETKGNVILSIYYSKTQKGECGYMSYSFGKGGTSATVPLGCFVAYAWVSGKQNFTTSGGPFCINNPDKWILIIKEAGIALKAP